MKTVLVANPKGGCGKTTISTNLAGYFAREGARVILSDLDRQESSLRWLERRPGKLPRIHGWKGRGRHGFHFQFVPDWIVMDSAAGARGERLKVAVAHVQRIIVPVMPSPLDTEASEDFLELLAELKRVRKEKVKVALVGNRVDRRTLSADHLDQFFHSTELPVLTCLRETQAYIRTALTGVTLFDLPPYQSRRDRGEWQPILDWLK
jgi:chromosome partitioning protein